MAKLQKGFTFVDGFSYSAANLNAIVDSALILPGAITEQTATAPILTDSFLYYNAGAAALRQCTLQNMVSAFPVDALAGTASLRTLGTGATQAAQGTDIRFSGRVTGIRLGQDWPVNDTVAAPKDLRFPSVNLSGGTNINWDSADIFFDFLTGSANKTYTFSNVRDGRVITVELTLYGYTGLISWPAMSFGAQPLQTNSLLNFFTFMNSGLGTNGVVKAV